MRKQLLLEGLSCANCANKIEDKLREHKGLRDVSVDFVNKKVTFFLEESNSYFTILEEIKKTVKSVEPHVLVREEVEKTAKNKITILMKGLHCASCAAKIEDGVKNITGIDDVHLDFVSNKLTAAVSDIEQIDLATEEIVKIIKKLEPHVEVQVIKDEVKTNPEHEEEPFTKTQLIKLSIGTLLFMTGVLLNFTLPLELGLFLISYFLIGGEVLTKAVNNIFRGQVFDENFLLFTAVNYADYFFSGLAMVALIILVSALFLKTDIQLLEDLNKSLNTPEANGSNKKVYELLVHISILIFLAFVGVKYLPFSNSLYTIAVIIIIYSVVWGLLLNVLGQYKNEMRQYSANLLNYKSFLPFLISASFLGSLVSFTPLKESIGKVLLAFSNLPGYFIIQLFLLITMLLCLVGIHMMITVTTLALTITPELIGLSNSAFALTLLTCWYMAMCISPFVPFTLIVAETINEKPLNIAFKHNLKFCLVMFFVAPALILFLNYLN